MHAYKLSKCLLSDACLLSELSPSDSGEVYVSAATAHRITIRVHKEPTTPKAATQMLQKRVARPTRVRCSIPRQA